jgi:hypothetical protein
VRARRLAAYALDLFFVAAPWAALLGIEIDPNAPQGYGALGMLIVVSVFGAVGTLLVLVVELVLLLRWGRTLGMACAGLVVERGSRALAAFLVAALVAGPAAAAAIVTRVFPIDASTGVMLVAAAPLACLALNAAFAAGASARTLVDRASGVVLAREAPDARRPRRLGGVVVDVVLLASAGAPVVLAFDWSDGGGAAIASGCAGLAVAVLEVLLAARTKATIGMRAVSSRAPP